MPADPNLPVRLPTLLEFPAHALERANGLERWTVRGQNFAVTWSRAVAAGAAFTVESADEILLLVQDAGVDILAASTRVAAPPRSVCILPAGAWRLEPALGATCAAIVSLREGVCGACNEDAYAPRDPRIRPVGTAYTPLRAGDQVRVLAIDAIAAPADKPRLKMLQTATLSINWVEYEGPRNRQALSPHAHSDFEQGSFGLAGDFVHHLRVPWGENAEIWQEDRHARLASPSLMVVPVGLIHTSEGVGPGHHLLIDVFSPPRADFIARGWVANAADYAAPPAASPGAPQAR